MTKAQEFMTAVEENNIFNHYSVIALRKENKKLQEQNFELEERLRACSDFYKLTNNK